MADQPKKPPYGGSTPTALFPDQQRFVSLNELHGFNPTSVIEPWATSELRERNLTLRAIIGDVAQERGRAMKSGSIAPITTGGASIFCPVLAEFIIGFYGGGDQGPIRILDPFAGGGTRAYMAARKGHAYTGIELRPNEAKRIRDLLSRDGFKATILTGDSTDPNSGGMAVRDAYSRGPYDLVFTCPPYGNLERYGGGSRDISEWPYIEFLEGIRTVLAWTLGAVRPGGLAVWVVGNYIADGEMIDLQADLSTLGRSVGWTMHDTTIISRRGIGSAERRIGSSARTKRLVRVHEYIVVFRRK